jgi:hypothetical protein
VCSITFGAEIDVQAGRKGQQKENAAFAAVDDGNSVRYKGAMDKTWTWT